jgi:hypothetical protein
MSDLAGFEFVNRNVESGGNLSEPESKLRTHDLETGGRLSKPESGHKEEKPPVFPEKEVYRKSSLTGSAISTKIGPVHPSGSNHTAPASELTSQTQDAMVCIDPKLKPEVMQAIKSNTEQESNNSEGLRSTGTELRPPLDSMNKVSPPHLIQAKPLLDSTSAKVIPQLEAEHLSEIG